MNSTALRVRGVPATRLSTIFLAALVTTLGLGFTPPLAASDCTDYSRITHWVGNVSLGSSDGAYDVAVSGGYAFVSTVMDSNRVAYLAVVDLSDPSAPVEVASTPLLGGPGGVDVSGMYAYVASAVALRVVDVSTPTAPAVAGSLATPGYVQDVVVVGSFAYVADYYSLRVVDITDPTSPVEIGSVPTPDQSGRLAVVGDYAYLAVQTGKLLIVDISAPATPTVVGEVPTPGQAMGVCVRGPWVYVADGFAGLQIVDASNPALPTITQEIPGYVSDVVLVGDRAYVPGKWILNVSNPGSPWIEHTLAIGGTRASVHGDYLYTAGGWLQIAMLGDSGSECIVGDASLPGQAEAISLDNTRAYVVNEDPGLSILDISDPTDPVVLGSLDTPGWAYDVVASGDYAYLTDSVGLHAIHVTNPAMPVIAGSVPLTGYPIELEVDAGLAYVALKAGKLRVVDVSTPSTPEVIGSLNTGQTELSAISKENDRVYLADYGGGVEIVSVHDPSNPASIGHVDTPNGTCGIAVSGSYLFVANTRNLRIVDVSDPGAPLEVRVISTPVSARDVFVDEEFAYVAGNTGGLHVFDVTDPASAFLVGGVDTPGRAQSLEVLGSYVFIADHDGGLQVTRAQCGPDAVDGTFLEGTGRGHCYPNPFRISTRIRADFPSTGRVDLEIHDVRGRRVWSSSRDTSSDPGSTFLWTGRDSQGLSLPSGVYFYDVRSGASRVRGKMTLLR